MAVIGAEPCVCLLEYIYMGSCLNEGLFWGPFYKGAVLYWGCNKGPEFRELPIPLCMIPRLQNIRCNPKP